MSSLFIITTALVVVVAVLLGRCCWRMGKMVSRSRSNSKRSNSKSKSKSKRSNSKSKSKSKSKRLIATFRPISPIVRARSRVDVVVVGGGLAGCVSALSTASNLKAGVVGGRVVLLDKCGVLGGNSKKASSGINGVLTNTQRGHGIEDDSIQTFLGDTIRSYGEESYDPLSNANNTETLVVRSTEAIRWLVEATGADLSSLTVLGGHSKSRTHRPSSDQAIGVHLMNRMVECLSEEAAVQVRTGVRMTRIARKNGLWYVLCEDSHEEIECNNVVVATGGYAYDRDPDSSLLAKFRPDLLQLPTTNGNWSSGDGIKILHRDVRADVVDMNKVQIHPTAFVDPADPTASTKFLAAEALRGAGGILLNSAGQRFCNELGTRDYITAKIQDQTIPDRVWLVLTKDMLTQAKGNGYVARGLVQSHPDLNNLADHLQVELTRLIDSFSNYIAIANGKSVDPFGKSIFPPGSSNLPLLHDQKEYPLYSAQITPALHYCMGGLRVDSSSQVIRDGGEGNSIEGLYAVGETTGGIHGNNRLGGNSLLECVVFGRIAGAAAAVAAVAAREGYCRPIGLQKEAETLSVNLEEVSLQSQSQKKLSMAEVEVHRYASDAWIVLDGVVYDVSSYLESHPGGREVLLANAGTDATTLFRLYHSDSTLHSVPLPVMGFVDQ